MEHCGGKPRRTRTRRWDGKRRRGFIVLREWRWTGAASLRCGLGQSHDPEGNARWGGRERWQVAQEPRGTRTGLEAPLGFSCLSGVAVDGSGIGCVAEFNNNTIRKATAGGVVTSLAGSPGIAGTADGTGKRRRGSVVLRRLPWIGAGTRMSPMATTARSGRPRPVEW